MSARPAISCFFPAYNDGGTIASMVVTAAFTLRALSDDWEIIVINDGSSDSTPAVLDELATKYPELRVIHHPKNRGYGGALQSGFGAAAKDWVFYTDGDAQYDVRELSKLVEALNPDVDLVNGYKIERHDPINRVIIGKLYQFGIRLMFGLKLADVDCDFRLIRRSVMERITLQSTSGAITVELMRKIQDTGAVMTEVPVHHFHRAYGRSQFFNFARVFRTLRNLITLWRMLMWPRVAGQARAAGAGE
jgi:glycosyltransferase involved in cell wall biosynthesis